MIVQPLYVHFQEVWRDDKELTIYTKYIEIESGRVLLVRESETAGVLPIHCAHKVCFSGGGVSSHKKKSLYIHELYNNISYIFSYHVQNNNVF